MDGYSDSARVLLNTRLFLKYNGLVPTEVVSDSDVGVDVWRIVSGEPARTCPDL